MDMNSSNIDRRVALATAHDLCPDLYGKVNNYFQFIFTKPIQFNNSEELGKFACLQVNIGQNLLPTLQYVLALSRVIVGHLGILGSILALIVFTRQEYRGCVTIIYHRFINFVEVINALILIHGGFDTLYQDYLVNYEVWVYINVLIVLRYRGSILFMVNMVVLWISCERVAACWTSRLFSFLNRKKVALMAIIVSMVLAVAICLPNGFTVDYQYDNATMTYQQIDGKITKTEGFKAYSVFYAVATLLHSALLLIISIIAVAGFLSMANRKRRLLASKNRKNQTDSEKELLHQYTTNLQLCVLQMCEAIPFTLNEIVVAAYLIQYNYVAADSVPGRTAPWYLTYQQAVDAAVATKIGYCIQFCMHFSVAISHCLRFYMYLLFSTKARNTCGDMVRRIFRGGTVGQSPNGNSRLNNGSNVASQRRRSS